MDIMDDVRIGWPDCTPIFDSNWLYNYHGPEYSFGDCGTIYSPAFFVSFKFICEYFVLNMFIG